MRGGSRKTSKRGTSMNGFIFTSMGKRKPLSTVDMKQGFRASMKQRESGDYLYDVQRGKLNTFK